MFKQLSFLTLCHNILCPHCEGMGFIVAWFKDNKRVSCFTKGRRKKLIKCNKCKSFHQLSEPMKKKVES